MKSTNQLVRFYLLAFLILSQTTSLFAQDVQVTAGSNRINIPPYVKDWEAAADLFFINLSCNFQQPTQIVLAIELTEDRLGRIAFGQSDVVFVPGSSFQQTITNSDFTRWDTWDYDQNMKSQVQQTGRLPDGVYNLCIEVLLENDPMPVADFCYLFEMFLPQNVQLILPDNFEIINEAYPLFQWAPIPWTQVVNYNLVIAQVTPGQQPQDAIASNDIFFQDSYSDENSTVYPPSGLPFEAGKTYAWFIYCQDDMGNPIGENNGQSEIYAFTYAGKNQANIMDWRDSVKYYTSDSFLETISIKDDPCPSIQELINSLQAKLKAARSRFQKAARKKAEGEAQAKKADQDAKDASLALADAEASLEKAKQQRDAILKAINDKNGASIVKPDHEFERGALIGASNGGSLQLDAGTALYIPADKIDSWLKSFNKLRSEYEGYTKLVSERSKAVAEQKAKKENAEKSKIEGTKKAAEGQAEMDRASAEILELEQALEDLIPRAKECGDKIENLKAEAAKASDKIMNAGVKVDEASRTSKGTGGQAEKHANDAKDKLDKAEDAFEKGDYELAGQLADEAELDAAKSKTAAEREDCYKRAKEKVEKAKKDLADRKDQFSKSDFSKAEGVLKDAEKTLDEVKDAIDAGDYDLAETLCAKVHRLIDEDFYEALKSIVCNEGSTIENVVVEVVDYKIGNLFINTQIEPGNLGNEFYQFFNSIGDPLDISATVDNVYKLTSVGHAYDLYSVRARYFVTVDYVCENGMWVTKNVRNTTRKVYFVKQKEIIQSRDLKKALVEKQVYTLYKSIAEIKRDEIIEKIYSYDDEIEFMISPAGKLIETLK